MAHKEVFICPDSVFFKVSEKKNGSIFSDCVRTSHYAIGTAALRLWKSETSMGVADNLITSVGDEY